MANAGQKPSKQNELATSKTLASTAAQAVVTRAKQYKTTLFADANERLHSADNLRSRLTGRRRVFGAL